MTVKKDVQCYITKDAQKVLDKMVVKQKKKNGRSVHKRDVLSDLIIAYRKLEKDNKKLKEELDLHE